MIGPGESQLKLLNLEQFLMDFLFAGTGLAPFRGFIQERDLAKKDGKVVGDTILYFGCRKRTEDYLYQEVN